MFENVKNRVISRYFLAKRLKAVIHEFCPESYIENNTQIFEYSDDIFNMTLKIDVDNPKDFYIYVQRFYGLESTKFERAFVSPKFGLQMVEKRSLKEWMDEFHQLWRSYVEYKEKKDFNQMQNKQSD